MSEAQQVDEATKSRAATPPTNNEIAPPLISSTKGKLILKGKVMYFNILNILAS